MTGTEKFLIVLGVGCFVMFSAFALITYETKNTYKGVVSELAKEREKTANLQSALDFQIKWHKEFSDKVHDEFAQKTNEIKLIEESLDPKNTRWAKIKKVREAVKQTIEEFGYEKHMTTTQMTTYASSVVDYSEQFDVTIPLVLAMTRRESAFNPKAKSHADAMGLIQIIPSTAREIAGDLGVRHYSMYKIRDNVRFGIFYIMKMLDEFDGDVSLAVRGYNCGPTYVHKVVVGEYSNYPIETRDYVRMILGDEKTEGFVTYYEKMGL